MKRKKKLEITLKKFKLLADILQIGNDIDEKELKKNDRTL